MQLSPESSSDQPAQLEPAYYASLLVSLTSGHHPDSVGVLGTSFADRKAGRLFYNYYLGSGPDGLHEHLRQAEPMRQYHDEKDPLYSKLIDKKTGSALMKLHSNGWVMDERIHVTFGYEPESINHDTAKYISAMGAIGMVLTMSKSNEIRRSMDGRKRELELDDRLDFASGAKDNMLKYGTGHISLDGESLHFHNY